MTRRQPSSSAPSGRATRAAHPGTRLLQDDGPQRDADQRLIRQLDGRDHICHPLILEPRAREGYCGADGDAGDTIAATSTPTTAPRGAAARDSPSSPADSPAEQLTIASRAAVARLTGTYSTGRTRDSPTALRTASTPTTMATAVVESKVPRVDPLTGTTGWPTTALSVALSWRSPSAKRSTPQGAAFASRLSSGRSMLFTAAPSAVPAGSRCGHPDPEHASPGYPSGSPRTASPPRPVARAGRSRRR
jgi:hypothetical protein